ncbi:MAG TPA: hypothetical protein VMR49_00440 [Candidatus Paceibacterota bacterium]|jgi:predicted transcriptional regulator|nr:hypothetical protein [Candidatus Paceibacterota bacterium]
MIYKNLIREMGLTQSYMILLGATVDFQKAFYEKAAAIINAVCKELRITQKEILNSELFKKASTDDSVQFNSEEVEKAYTDFKIWYEKNVVNCYEASQ